MSVSRGVLFMNEPMAGSKSATRQHPTTLDTLFDLASVTKLFVATSFMRLVEARKVSLDQPVVTVLPAFQGKPNPLPPMKMTTKPGATVPILERAVGPLMPARSPFATCSPIRRGCQHGGPSSPSRPCASGSDGADRLFFSYPDEEPQIVYSDIGLILLGMAVTQLTGQGLAAAVRSLVLAPLGLVQTRYLPIGAQACEPAQVAPTEQCQWRQQHVAEGP